ncbi:MAG: hypothetical protein ABIP06_14210 [Pyrinomonadaceae bacterium]
MLSLFGLIVIVVATIQAYKTAKSSGRNAVGWALITFALTFGIQLVVPFVFGVVFAVIMSASGSSLEEIQDAITIPSIIIGIVCLVLSVIAVSLIFKYLSKVPEEIFFTPPPSPPKTFD